MLNLNIKTENMHLIILAAGAATRMLPIHQNVYPKILTNLGNEVQLIKMLDSYKNVSKCTILVDNRLQKRQIVEMLLAFDRTENIEVHNLECGAIGTLATIRLAMNRFFGDNDCKNVMISWSDICPTDEVDVVGNRRKNIIFTDKCLRHRMHADSNNKVTSTKLNNGNIPGLYFIKDLKSFVKGEPYAWEDGQTTDLCEVFVNEKVSFKTIDDDFHDTGDVHKYKEYLKNVDIKQRYFNDVEINGNEVVKTAKTEHGKSVLKAEVEFYENLAKTNVDSFPRLISKTDDSITISRIHGYTINDYIDLYDPYYTNKELAKEIYEHFKTSAAKLHESSKATKAVKSAVINEYVDVPTTRWNKIHHILPTITNVNNANVNINEVFSIIEEIGTYLSKTSIFTLIHGDPNTTNTMAEVAFSDITKIMQLKFIDPRGQFGGNKLYGDPSYDAAKFLYGLTGYDRFNLTKDIRFSYCHETKEIYYDCINGYNLDELTDSSLLKYLVGLIWFKLPYYTINNVNKSIVAHAHGMSLITKYGKQLLELIK